MEDRENGSLLQVKGSTQIFFFSVTTTHSPNSAFELSLGLSKPSLAYSGLLLLVETKCLYRLLFDVKLLFLCMSALSSSPVRSHRPNYHFCLLVAFLARCLGSLSEVVNRQAGSHRVAFVRDVLYDLLLSSFPTYPTFKHDNNVKQE